MGLKFWLRTFGTPPPPVQCCVWKEEREDAVGAVRTKEETTQEETTKEEMTQEETTNEETTQEKTTKEETTQEERTPHKELEKE